MREAPRLPEAVLPSRACRRRAAAPLRAGQKGASSAGRMPPATGRDGQARRGRSAPSRAVPASEAPRGLPTGSPTGVGTRTLVTSDFPYAWYLRQVTAKIEEAWQHQNQLNEPSAETARTVRDPAGRIDSPASDRPDLGQRALRSGGAARDRRGEPVPAVASGLAQALAHGGDDLPARARARMSDASSPRVPRRSWASSCGAALGGALWSPPAVRPQAPDVMLNVIASGAKKLNIAIPEFTLRAAGPIPTGSPSAFPRSWARTSRSPRSSRGLGHPALPANNAGGGARGVEQRRRGGRACRSAGPAHDQRRPRRRWRCGSTT